MTNKLYLLTILAALFLATSCVDEDPLIENEEELITTVTYTLNPRDNDLETVVLGFSDPDGDGGNAPMMSSTGTLRANRVYDGSVSFGGPEGAIDAEIVEEGDEHQIFYRNTAGMRIAYLNETVDLDDNGDPIGIVTVVNTGAAGSGNLTITLRHEPAKGVAAIDNPAAAGGSTDAEVVFPVTVQ